MQPRPARRYGRRGFEQKNYSCRINPAIWPHDIDDPFGQDEGAVTAQDILSKDLVVLLPRLRRFARTLTGSAVEADDLVQDACIRAISRAELYDPTHPLDRWMFRITRNLWYSELRKRKVRMGTGIVAADESDELVTRETGEARVLADDVHKAVAALPKDLATVLLVVTVEGYSYAEAAELLDIPAGTVMSRIHRARKMLSARLNAAESEAS